jgi:AraC-like DNA-binding protein
MLNEELDEAKPAFRVGYESPPQFSRESQWMFGTPPRPGFGQIQRLMAGRSDA